MYLLPSTIQKLLRIRAIRYVLVGGTAYVFEMVVLFTLKSGGTSELKSVAISFWVGLVIAFVLQKTLAFQDKRRHAKVLLKQTVLYLLLVTLNYTFTLLIVRFSSDLIGVYIARTIALAITTVWNFFFYKEFFSQKSENRQTS